jgi:hypothetical protein
MMVHHQYAPRGVFTDCGRSPAVPPIGRRAAAPSAINARRGTSSGPRRVDHAGTRPPSGIPDQ